MNDTHQHEADLREAKVDRLTGAFHEMLDNFVQRDAGLSLELIHYAVLRPLVKLIFRLEALARLRASPWAKDADEARSAFYGDHMNEDAKARHTKTVRGMKRCIRRVPHFIEPHAYELLFEVNKVASYFEHVHLGGDPDMAPSEKARERGRRRVKAIFVEACDEWGT